MKYLANILFLFILITSCNPATNDTGTNETDTIEKREIVVNDKTSNKYIS